MTGHGQIHFEIREEDPWDVKVGEWVLFLPIGIAEEVYDNVPMTRVTDISRTGDTYTIVTQSGAMIREKGEKVQVID